MSEALRVLFTESSRNVGGQELQFLSQMTEMSLRGVGVRLACLPAGSVYATAQALGFVSEPVGFRNSLHLPSIVKVRRILTEWQPDAVVCHSGHDANVVAVAVRSVGKKPRVIRSRTYQHGTPHAWTYNLFADVTVVPSEDLRNRILSNQRIRADRVRVLYPGFSFAKLDEQSQQPLSAALRDRLDSPSGPVIVHAAMLRPEKGHLMMLEVVRDLIASWPALRYVVAGEGEQDGAIRRRIEELRLGDHVVMAGFVAPISPLLSKADLVVMPSTYEPLGMSQTEALALGIPVVASRTGGIPETIQDGVTGLLVEAGDRKSWIERLSYALANRDEMRAMATAGRRFVRKRFSLKENVDTLMQLVRMEKKDFGGHHRP